MDVNFPKLEEKILKFWKDNQIFEKSVKRRKKSRNFVFYEGPPTANGRPGIHHVLARVFKDIICRYKTMRGFRVERKAGWDTHGLPVELEVEKKLGLKNKKDIEEYGIDKFNEKCRESVWQYKQEWEKLTERIGYWLDIKNPYITYQNEYIESVWWILKEIYKKGLLYQDYKVVPYCPRCGTPLSSHEVAQGYKKVKDPSICVKFNIKNSEFKNTCLLIWTTTPWTLPGNVAVAVNPEIIYAQIKLKSEAGEEYLILAKEKIVALQIEGEIVKEIKGKDLVGLVYEAVYSTAAQISKSAYRVIAADFVSLDDGTGLVHIAPAFGAEDMEAIKKQNIECKLQGLPEFPILLPVDEEGRFTSGVKNWAGMFVKDADSLIINDLRERGVLFKEQLREHDYPFCWRCHSPLLYYARQSWFIAATKVKNDLIKNNQKINWVPDHLKNGRFGEWLSEVKDWALSRERYWGTPLPVWQCKTCKNQGIIGSLKELLAQKFSSNNYFIARHGFSMRQIKKISSCWPEKVPLPLTKKGKKEAATMAKELKKEKIDLIFSSDLLRTKQTAEIIGKEIGLEPKFDEGLRDYDVGIFNMKNPKLSWNYLAGKNDFLSARLPKGESLGDIRKRMYGFLAQIDQKYKNKNILIVSHELPLTILEGALSGLSLLETLGGRKSGKTKLIATGGWRKIKFNSLPLNQKSEMDFHRPYIDEVKFVCPECQGSMVRVREVIDCWFDSGSMPFAQYHYPFKNKALIEKGGQFPADYVSEAIDQTRGWFYTLHAISSLLGRGSAFLNVISLGHILDEKGEKMSKSKGNVVEPWFIVEKYGADAARWYFYAANQPGEPKLFSEKDIDQILKRFILILWNCFAFWKTYKVKNPKYEIRNPKPRNVLDGWVFSRLNKLISEVTKSLDAYDVTVAARAIERFVVNDLSLWYIRRARRRFQRSESETDLVLASDVLQFVFLTLSKLTAPFIPFLSEEIYNKTLNLKPETKNSVHLEDWPIADKKVIDEKLETAMEVVRNIVTHALAERAKAGIKVRQPLSVLRIKDDKSKISEGLLDLIKEEVNVKKVVFDAKIKEGVGLDTEITPELKEEGLLREIIRNVQEARKEAGFNPQNKILVAYDGSENLKNSLANNEDFILREGRIKELVVKGKTKYGFEKETMVDGEKLWLGIKKIK